MLSVTEGIFIFITVCELILGVLGNGFIGLVNCIECIKNKKFSIIGLILTGLAVSRICLIWIIVSDGFLRIFAQDMYVSSDLLECIHYLWIIVNQSSVWFATSLSTFYFLKIANFSHHVFLWLKGRLNRILLLLLGFLLISWFLTFPQIVRIFNDHKIKNGNRTCQLNKHKGKFFIDQVSLNLGIIFLFTLFLITCFLLVASLWRHNRKMQLHVTGFTDPNTEVHMKAMKVLMSFAVLFILYFIGIAIEISYFVLPENKLLFIIGMTTTVIYPWGHSFIFILGNSKLKQVFFEVTAVIKMLQERETISALHGQACREIDVLLGE